MDVKKLFEAAYTGNVELLHKFRQKNPLILVDVALTSPQESLLHIATKAGQLGFIRELIKLSPALARESNKDGFRPLDIASMAGNEEIVKEIIKVDNEICRLKGKDQRTALHYAAIKGRVGVINLLLSTCPKAVEDITVYGETALQIAVKNHQFEAFTALFKRLEDPSSMESVINWGDCNGDTVLHLAASRKQLEVVELLLGNNSAISGMVKANATNSKGLTAMDLLDIVTDSPNDVHLREILRRAGALGAQDVSRPIPSTPSLHQVSQTQHETQSEPPPDWIEYFKFLTAPFGPPYALIQGTLKAHGTIFEKIPAEDCPTLRRGSVAWVGSGPDFFISLADHTEWENAHTVFGFVLPEDIAIAEKMAHLPTKPELWSNVKVTVLKKPIPLRLRKSTATSRNQ